MRVRVRFDPRRRFPQQREQDGGIMWSEIPDNIDIAAEEPEIESLNFHTIDIAKFAVLNQLAQFLDGRAVLESVPNHQYQVLLLCQRDELFRLGDARS